MRVAATQTEVAKVSPAEAAGAREGEHEVEGRCLMKDDANGHSCKAEGREGKGRSISGAAKPEQDRNESKWQREGEGKHVNEDVVPDGWKQCRCEGQDKGYRQAVRHAGQRHAHGGSVKQVCVTTVGFVGGHGAMALAV